MLHTLPDAPTGAIAYALRSVASRERFGLGGKVAVFRRQPLHHPCRDLVEKTRRDVVAQLPMKHPTLRMRQIQSASRTRDRNVREAALLFDAVVFAEAVLAREK